MKQVTGNLIDLAKNNAFDVIVHGCNCMCTMGAGVALAVREAFPAAYAADLATERGSHDKLGSYSSATVQVGNSSLVVINAYTQFDWRGVGPKVNYSAVAQVFQRVKQDFPGMRIGYPQIGAGLAGGSWAVIEHIIDQELDGEDHTLVLFGGKR